MKKFFKRTWDIFKMYMVLIGFVTIIVGCTFGAIIYEGTARAVNSYRISHLILSLISYQHNQQGLFSVSPLSFITEQPDITNIRIKIITAIIM